VFLSGAHPDYTCVDSKAYTVNENSQFLVLVTYSVIILYIYGAVFDFGDMTESGILCWNIQIIQLFFCPTVIVIQEICRK